MDFILKTVQSFTAKFNKRGYFSYSNYFRYEESAKFCLCANEFRKLKNYVDYFKYLVDMEMPSDVMCITINFNTFNMIPIYMPKTTKQAIAMLLIINTEDRIEKLISREITINSSDQQHLGNLLKVFKTLNPEVFLLTTQLRQEKNVSLTRDVMEYYLHENMQEHILTLDVEPQIN